MWIEIETSTKRLVIPEVDEPIEFSENGTAQVSKDAGEQLIDNYDTISETSD